MESPTIESIEERLRELPPEKLAVVADFVSYWVDMTERRSEAAAIDTMLASESVLGRGWQRPEEEDGGVAYADFQIHEAVIRVAELPTKEVTVASKERRPDQSVEERNDHAFGRASSLSSSASAARRTASAIAFFETLPSQDWLIDSQSLPDATCSRTSATKMRVPRKVNLP